MTARIGTTTDFLAALQQPVGGVVKLVLGLEEPVQQFFDLGVVPG